MNKIIFSTQSIIIILVIYIFNAPLPAQTVNSGKTGVPPVVKKTEIKEDNGKTSTPAEKKNVTGEEKKQADAKNPADGKTPPDEKKTADSKEKTREQMDEKQKGDKISTTLDYGIQKDRKIAIGMITEIKDEPIKRELLRKIAEIANTDADMEIRKTAVTALGDHKSTENSQAVIRALDDEIDDVKIAACYAVGKMKLSEAKPKLIELLKKQDLAASSTLTDAVVIALGDLNAPEVVDYAVEGIKNIKNSKIDRKSVV